MLNKTLTNKVIELLKTYPNLRDDDQYLISMVWMDEIGEEQHSASAFSLLGKIARHEVSNPESIRRTRQKAQQENPDLRGPNYQKRQTEYQDEFKQALEECSKDAAPQQDMLDN